MKLPNYIEQLAKGLMKAGFSRSHAIATAVYNVDHWRKGIPTGNMPRVRPETKAAAAAAWAEWLADRAKAHTEKSVEHAQEFAAQTTPVASVTDGARTSRSTNVRAPSTQRRSHGTHVASLHADAQAHEEEATKLEKQARSLAKSLVRSGASGSRYGRSSGSGSGSGSGSSGSTASGNAAESPMWQEWDATHPAGEQYLGRGPHEHPTSPLPPAHVQGVRSRIAILRKQAASHRSQAKTLRAQADSLAKVDEGDFRVLRNVVANFADVHPPSLTKRSGMIACVAGSGPWKGKHVTLAYLGPDVDDDLHRRALRHAMEMAVNHAPPRAKVGGIMRFPPGEDGSPVVVPVDSKDMDTLHYHLRQAGLHRSEHGFHPHMTLRYDKTDNGPLPAGLPPHEMEFTHISVHRGKHVDRFPFTGRRIDAASEYAHPLPIGGREMATTPNAADRHEAYAAGAALPPLHPGGEPRFPIRNASELERAVRMVGLAKGNKGAIRRFIMRRARALGLSHMIPKHWLHGGLTEAAIDALDYQYATQLADPDHDGDDDSGPNAMPESEEHAKKRFDIHDEASLRWAIRNAHHAGHHAHAVRRHIMRKAKALGKEHMIPGHWRKDGSLSTDPDHDGDNDAPGGRDTDHDARDGDGDNDASAEGKEEEIYKKLRARGLDQKAARALAEHASHPPRGRRK